VNERQISQLMEEIKSASLRPRSYEVASPPENADEAEARLKDLYGEAVATPMMSIYRVRVEDMGDSHLQAWEYVVRAHLKACGYTGPGATESRVLEQTEVESTIAQLLRYSFADVINGFEGLTGQERTIIGSPATFEKIVTWMRERLPTQQRLCSCGGKLLRTILGGRPAEECDTCHTAYYMDQESV